MTYPSVSLLLPNRDNERILDLTLERLLEHTTYPNFELIVIDDASTDDGLSILRRWRDERRFDNFTLLEREHSGVARSLNAGAEVASGDLLVQLDGDATVESPAWLERMVSFHQSDDRVGVVTPLVTFEDGRIHAAGINIVSEKGMHDRGTRPKEPAGQRTFHSIADRMTPKEAGSLVTEPAEVDSSLGVHMLFSREIYDELGGYDEGFSPVWFEDLDLALSSRRLGERVGLPESELDALLRGGMIHDIGKIGIPDAILQKPGLLTAKEQREMQRHPELGERIARPLGSAADLLPIIRHHHEAYDGSGYPDGLRGEEIPLVARIVSVCDGFDALTSTRPYRPGRSQREAVEILERGRGRQWDPDLVDAFVDGLRSKDRTGVA